MPLAKPQWVFTRTASLAWAWRAIPKNGGTGEMADAFPDLEEATADAIEHGFDPFSQYWITRVDGRTTHYRPGEAPLDLPSDAAPRAR